MIAEHDAGAVRFEDGRPVAVGDQELIQPTSYVQTKSGFWGLYGVGEEALVVYPNGAFRGARAAVGARLRGMSSDDRVWPGEDREAAARLLELLVDAGDSTRAGPSPPRGHHPSRASCRRPTG